MTTIIKWIGEVFFMAVGFFVSFLMLFPIVDSIKIKWEKWRDKDSKSV